MKNALVLFFLIIPYQVFAQSFNVELKYSYNQEREQYVFQAINSENEDMTVVAIFDKLYNLKADVRLPFIKTLSPGMYNVFTLSQANSRNGDFSYKYYVYRGVANPNINEDYRYLIPVSNGKKVGVGKLNFQKSDSENEPYGLVFKVSLGDTITASRGGLIKSIVDVDVDNTDEINLSIKSNRITIQHEDGTLAHYSNFAVGSSLVEKGDFILAGDPIAKAGQGSSEGGSSLYFHMTYMTLDVRDSRHHRSWSEWHFYKPKFITKEHEGELVPGVTYEALINSDLITQEMSKGEKKKYLKKKN